MEWSTLISIQIPDLLRLNCVDTIGSPRAGVHFSCLDRGLESYLLVTVVPTKHTLCKLFKITSTFLNGAFGKNKPVNNKSGQL
jgi:hypothetical protein